MNYWHRLVDYEKLSKISVIPSGPARRVTPSVSDYLLYWLLGDIMMITPTENASSSSSCCAGKQCCRCRCRPPFQRVPANPRAARQVGPRSPTWTYNRQLHRHQRPAAGPPAPSDRRPAITRAAPGPAAPKCLPPAPATTTRTWSFLRGIFRRRTSSPLGFLLAASD